MTVTIFGMLRRKIPKHLSQLLATLAVSLGPFAAGMGKGYSSPAMASLRESHSPMLSQRGEKWIPSLSLLGAMFGCLLGGFLLKLGRRKSILTVALPFAASWLLTIFAERNIWYIYCTSFVGGVCSAVILLATQVYVSEIAHPDIRGMLSFVLKMATHLGTLVAYILGAYVDWKDLARIAAIPPILLFIAILPLPETPSYLLYYGRDEDALKSIAWLRPCDDNVSDEIDTLKKNIKNKSKKFIPKCSSQLAHLLLITCGLVATQKFSGVTVFPYYAVDIFTRVFGISLNAHSAAITAASIQFFGSMLSGLVIDTVGRLPLLVISNIFIALSYFVFGLYNWWEQEFLPPNHPGLGHTWDWIPLTCVIVFTLFSAVGIGSITQLMIAEIFPLEYRNFGGAVATCFGYFVAFVAVSSYTDIQNNIGLYAAFWIYTGVSVAGLIFIYLCVPETAGELEEMELPNHHSRQNGGGDTLHQQAHQYHHHHGSLRHLPFKLTTGQNNAYVNMTSEMERGEAGTPTIIIPNYHQHHHINNNINAYRISPPSSQVPPPVTATSNSNSNGIPNGFHRNASCPTRYSNGNHIVTTKQNIIVPPATRPTSLFPDLESFRRMRGTDV